MVLAGGAMQIGEAAKRSGIERTAIRYYETEGILPSPARSAAGYRRYGDEDVELLRFVRRLKALELPLEDIRSIVRLRVDGQAPCAVVRDALDREAAAIQARVEDLLRLQQELAELRRAADLINDDWPTSCVCHVLESTV
jgi:DNA-binding transcriptional MerR regulator